MDCKALNRDSGAERAGGSQGIPWRRVGLLLIAELSLASVLDVLVRSSALVEGLLSDLFCLRAGGQLMERAAGLDLDQLEDPATHNMLDRARQWTGDKVALFGQIAGSIQDTIALLLLMTAIAAFSPGLFFVVASCALPLSIVEARFARRRYSFLTKWIPVRRFNELHDIMFAEADSVGKKRLGDSCRGSTGFRYRSLQDLPEDRAVCPDCAGGPRHSHPT